MTAGNSITFVVSNGPKLQDDPHTRKQIRKHAMKHAALSRRKRGNYGRANVGQLPVLSDTGDVVLETKIDTEDNLACITQKSIDLQLSELNTEVVLIQSVAPKYPWTLTYDRKAKNSEDTTTPKLNLAALTLSSAYEAARCRFQVDVVDLSMLTNFNVGEGTRAVLAADPGRLVTLLGHSQWSYLQFIPSYYGLSDCLTTATDCLLAKVRSLLKPQHASPKLELGLYVRALRSLQQALHDKDGCTEADVLCASQLLSLHELLNGSQDTAWDRHTKGSIRLIRHRTPDRFVSDFDKALFVAHLGPIVFECLINHKPCYLADPKWLKLYQSFEQESHYLNNRSHLTISIRSQMFKLPGLWHDIHEVVMSPRLFDDTVLIPLRHRCREAHQDLLDWMQEYKAHCLKLSLAVSTQQELAMRRELFGVATECLIVVKRLLGTIYDEERCHLETEAQDLAQMIYDLHKQPSAKHSWLFSGHEVSVAQGILSSKNQWAGTSTDASEGDRKTASRMRYVAWDDLIRPRE